MLAFNFHMFICRVVRHRNLGVSCLFFPQDAFNRVVQNQLCFDYPFIFFVVGLCDLRCSASTGVSAWGRCVTHRVPPLPCHTGVMTDPLTHRTRHSGIDSIGSTRRQAVTQSGLSGGDLNGCGASVGCGEARHYRCMGATCSWPRCRCVAQRIAGHGAVAGRNAPLAGGGALVLGVAERWTLAILR